MMENPLLLTDCDRVGQFGVLGRTRRLFRAENRILWTDSSGVSWLGVRVGDYGFAVSDLPSWAFDPYISERRSSKLDEIKRSLRGAGDTVSRLEAKVQTLHLGPRCERVLWSIHRALRHENRSLMRVPDFLMACDVFGQDKVNWPRHWRADLRRILAGLTHLHIGQWSSERLPEFGSNTVLPTAVTDLRGRTEDTCDRDCLLHRGNRHHHIQINVGRGFLGVLEELASPETENGTRFYDFFRTSKKKGKTLSQLGKTGKMVPAFLPAKIGEPDRCSQVTRRQQFLLQALMREATRARGESENAQPSGADLEKITRAIVPDHCGRQRLSCPLLDRERAYIGFNGNKLRRGLGYRIASRGGWLAKAGFQPTNGTFTLSNVAAFFDDLAQLSQKLQIVVAALDPTGEAWFDLEQIRSMCARRRNRNLLDRLHLRVFAADDWCPRWTRFFCPAMASVNDLSASNTFDRLLALGLSQVQLAHDLGIDPSFLSKVLRGRKKCPALILDRAKKHLDATPNESAISPIPAPDPLADYWVPGFLPSVVEPVSILVNALNLLRMGWSVVPMLPGEKKPCVCWSAYQNQRATEGDITSWYSRWPTAGIAVILGPISNLFVIDVDGTDAHRTLLQRLGGIPSAPLAVSGSRKLHRYHLYFKCPSIDTKAKATPWCRSLEFRGNRGLIVVPPSIHASGNRYVWAPGRSISDISLPDVPVAVLAALDENLAKVENAPQTLHLPIDSTSRILAPSTMRFLNGDFANGPAWNQRLFGAACDMQARGCALQEAEPLLMAGARPWNPTEKENALRTIRSAFSQQRAPARH